jgi:hypothetical protein
MPGGFDDSKDNLGYPQGDEADAASKKQYAEELVRRRKAAGVAEGASEAVIEHAEKEQRKALTGKRTDEYYKNRALEDRAAGATDNRWWWQKLAGTGKASGGLGVKKTTGTIGKKGGGRRTRGRRTRGRRTRDRVPRKTKPHKTKRASSNRGSDWRSHIKRTMKNNPNMKFGKDLLKLASRTFKKGVKPIYS